MGHLPNGLIPHSEMPISLWQQLLVLEQECIQNRSVKKGKLLLLDRKLPRVIFQMRPRLWLQTKGFKNSNNQSFSACEQKGGLVKGFMFKKNKQHMINLEAVCVSTAYVCINVSLCVCVCVLEKREPMLWWPLQKTWRGQRLGKQQIFLPCPSELCRIWPGGGIGTCW